MGRLIGFLANMATGDPAVAGRPRGIAVSGDTAVIVYPDQRAEVVGDFSAYIVTAPDTVPLIGASMPLSWQDIEVIRVGTGKTFNLARWEFPPDENRTYRINVNEYGRLAVEGNNDIY
jgi:cyanophycinase-like exopeptidase